MDETSVPPVIREMIVCLSVFKFCGGILPLWMQWETTAECAFKAKMALGESNN